MPKYKRFQTKYPGVFYIIGKSRRNGNEEKIFYIKYRKKGQQVEERVGRQFKDNMTAAKASHIRTDKIKGRLESNIESNKKTHITLNELFEDFKDHKQHLKALQEDIYRYNKHLRPAFGDCEVLEILPSDVSKFKSNLLKKLQPQTVRHILTLLRRIINLGFSLKLCPTLDFKIEMPKVDNIVTEFLTEEEYKQLMQTLDKEENKVAVAIVKMALFTGMRRGEIFKLKWNDLDFEHGFIHIRDPKGTISQSIPMNVTAREVLKSVEKTYDSPYVFPGKNGKKRVTIQRPLRRIKKNAGLSKDFRYLQGLRHTFASELASSGEVDMYTLQKLMTHKDFRMTQRYAHLHDDTLKKASEIMDVLSKKRTPTDND
ncbi:tyrosine-type recombinase/integrase [Candidatus Latescibacterota bacterium]